MEYLLSDHETRKAIRGLFASHAHFAWAATPRLPATTDEGFRQHLVLIFMEDQGKDSGIQLLACRRSARGRVLLAST
jgi:hypothetical protein